MLKILTAVCALYVAMHGAAYAVCTADNAMTKSSDVSEVLSNKLAKNADGASKLMSEMGDIMGTGTVTDATCVKLDSLMVRAKAL